MRGIMPPGDGGQEARASQDVAKGIQLDDEHAGLVDRDMAAGGALRAVDLVEFARLVPAIMAAVMVDHRGDHTSGPLEPDSRNVLHGAEAQFLANWLLNSTICT
jgi:hypothetical protein